jgi:hypothetical protein
MLISPLASCAAVGRLSATDEFFRTCSRDMTIQSKDTAFAAASV